MNPPQPFPFDPAKPPPPRVAQAAPCVRCAGSGVLPTTIDPYGGWPIRCTECQSGHASHLDCIVAAVVLLASA